MAQTIFRVEYIGRCKERQYGASAFGWVDGGWSLILPKSVLFEWFGLDQFVGEKPTLYQCLGCRPDAAQVDLKKAYRTAAKQWHPDHCREDNAVEKFQEIQSAFEILKTPNMRAKYNAGLKLEATLGDSHKMEQPLGEYGWRSPLRCGFILAEYKPSRKWNVVEQILQWEDITNSRNQTMVSSWIFGEEAPIINWA